MDQELAIKYYYYYYTCFFTQLSRWGWCFPLTSESYPDSGRSSTFRRMCALPSIAVFTSWGILFLQGPPGDVSPDCCWLLRELLLLLVLPYLWPSTFSVFLISSPGTFLSSLFPYLLCACRLVLIHLLWVLLSPACLLLLSLVCEIVSVCPFWSRSPTVPWLCCSLLLRWACAV